MIEEIKAIIVYLVPIITGSFATIFTPLLIKKIAVKYIQKKLDEISPTKQQEDIYKKLNSIENEIYIMRGKKK